jgi:hypothetical protein
MQGVIRRLQRFSRGGTQIELPLELRDLDSMTGVGFLLHLDQSGHDLREEGQWAKGSRGRAVGEGQ